jgi:hypothetical protein
MAQTITVTLDLSTDGIRLGHLCAEQPVAVCAN